MISYVKGDALQPQAEGMKIIPHVCNNKGGWGKGFVLAITRKWKAPMINYKALKGWPLGMIQFVWVENDIAVTNMIAQDGFARTPEDIGTLYLDYDSLRRCMQGVAELARSYNASIHAPRFGAGLAGGDWKEIEKIIEEEWASRGIPVTIYDL